MNNITMRSVTGSIDMEKKIGWWHTFAGLMVIVWIITWYGAIWIPNYTWQLFFTGVFSLILGLLSKMVGDEEER